MKKEIEKEEYLSEEQTIMVNKFIKDTKPIQVLIFISIGVTVISTILRTFDYFNIEILRYVFGGINIIVAVILVFFSVSYIVKYKKLKKELKENESND